MATITLRSEAITRRLQALLLRNYLKIFTLSVISLIILSAILNNFFDKTWLGDIVLNLSTELIGALIVLYLGIERILERREISQIRILPKYEIVDDIQNRVAHRIQILDTWTALLDEDHHRNFCNAIVSAINRDVNIQILLLRPDSEGERTRNEELKYTLGVDVVKQKVADNLRKLHLLQERIRIECGEKSLMFQVRLCDDIPNPIYVLDDIMYHAPFPRRDRSDFSTQLRMNVPLDGSETVGENYRVTFDRLWNFSDKGNPVQSLNSYMLLTIEDVDARNYHFYFAELQNKADRPFFFVSIYDGEESEFLYAIQRGTRRYQITVRGMKYTIIHERLEKNKPQFQRAEEALSKMYDRRFTTSTILRFSVVSD